MQWFMFHSWLYEIMMRKLREKREPQRKHRCYQQTPFLSTNPDITVVVTVQKAAF
jgi:hypothetical protein